MSSTTRTYYDDYWSPSGFSPAGEGLPETLRAVLSRHVASGDRAIDVGCGDGHKLGHWLAPHAARYTGFDVSERAIELARAAGFEAELITDAACLPLAEDSVDVVASTEVLEHLFDPISAVREMRRVLRPGGRLIVTVPNIANWRSRLDFALLGRWHPGGDELSVTQPWRDPHIRFFTHRTLGAMLTEAGYELVELGGLQDASVAVRMPLLRRWLGRGPAGRPTRLLVRLDPGLFANQLYAVARA